MNNMNIKNFKEYLNEMATVFIDKRSNVSISVNGDANRIGDCYFKFYNSASYKTATKIARIKFDSPKYVTHKNSNEMKNWVLNTQEREELIKHLNDKDFLDGHEFTFFQQAIIMLNHERGLGRSIHDCIEIMLKNSQGDKYLSLDLPIPNYLELN